MKLNSNKINIINLRNDSIDMLKHVKESLDDYQIKYWLDFGSLLGAARNGKSIPWDGDFDLSTLDNSIIHNTSLLNSLDKKGFSVEIDYANIKIHRKKSFPGYFRLDIHRYREVDSNAVYEYGINYEDKYKKIVMLKDIINLCISAKSYHRERFPTFGNICRILLRNGVEPNKLDEIEELEFSFLSYPTRAEFILENNSFRIFYQKFLNDSLKIKLIFKIFKIMPLSSLIVFEKKIDSLLAESQKNPKMKVAFPIKRFSELSRIKFNDLEFNGPSNIENYLESVYGKDWMVPRQSWEISTDSPLKDNNEN